MMEHDTLIAPVDRDQPEREILVLAGQVVRDGGLVAFPTETVYGLGANALDAAAVHKIFTAKGRPANDPIIVHLAAAAQLGQVAIDVPDLAQELAQRFWPGALTLILKKHPRIPDNLTAGQPTVAVRVPAHPIAQGLIDEADVPIGAPSANRFSRPSPTRALHVLADLQGRVDVVLDGGSTDIGVESTIIDLTAAVPVVLRPGGVPLEALRAIIPTLAFTPRTVAQGETAPAPGTLAKHYAPDATLRVYHGPEANVYEAMRRAAEAYAAAGQRVGILATDTDALLYEGLHAQIMLLGTTDADIAAHLFDGLRALDAADVDVILVRAPQQHGLGLAVWDRLLRAAEGHIISVL